MRIPAVVVFSEADRASLHVRMADEAYPIGPAPSRESYLRIDKMLAVARASGCDALHPGYGFLAENPNLALPAPPRIVTFIGPSPEAMERLGSKTAARQLARRCKCSHRSRHARSHRANQDATEMARQIGFPVVLKAVAGGGGKGMRLIERESEVAAAWRDASSEATNAFGDGRMYLEKFLEHPRHIEIQVLGDHHGHMVYLGERECSVQRRYQKVIEEAPSPIVTPELRRAMGRSGGETRARGRLHECGHTRISRRRAAQFLFPRNEYAASGRASRHGIGDGVRFGEAANSRRRRRTAAHRRRKILNCAAMPSSAAFTPRIRTITFSLRPAQFSRAIFLRALEFVSTTESTPDGPCQRITIRCSGS